MTQRYIKIIAVLTALTVSGNLLAQDDDEPGYDRGRKAGEHRGPGPAFGDPAMMIERMASQLDLAETQRQSLSNIMEAARPEFAALREAARENREAVHALDVDDADYGAALQNLAARSGEHAAELTLLTGRVRSEVAAILTAEQRATLETRKSRIGERRRHGGRNRTH
ncbi:MAG: Spy/CpxP family protein refolding chaperone [Woeseiaceae bacterium]|nr:Spy/CpxP family protein refolding chaperone [Woeseiaceae bacterium]